LQQEPRGAATGALFSNNYGANMMMKHTKLLAGTLLAVASITAGAADINGGKPITFTGPEDTQSFKDTFTSAQKGLSFLDNFTFSITSNSMLGGGLTSTALGSKDLDITSFGLYSSTGDLIAAGVQESSGAFDSWKLTAYQLQLGDYSLRVGGKVSGSGGSFGGTASIAPVPEPEAWSMIVGSLVCVGIVVRRRKPRGMPLDGQTA
jgi:hypothetical protein